MLATWIDPNGLPGNGTYQDFSIPLNPGDPAFNHVPAGNYYIGWIIDADQEVWERSESNNKGHLATTTYFPGQGDFEITNESYTSVICTPVPCSSTPPVIVSGSTIDFSVDVTNTGTGLSVGNYLGYYLSSNTTIDPFAGYDHLLGSSFVHGGPAGSTVTATRTFDLSQPTFNSIPNGTYYMYSFCLYPNNVQPSGLCNLSRINDKVLELNTEYILNHKNINKEIYTNIYSISYNYLIISNGKGKLQYF